MNFRTTAIRWLPLLLILPILAGCSGSNPNPISAFEPEVVNEADAFQFQITDADNVSATLTYEWSNTGAQATIDHSTVTAEGMASVVLLDADDMQVYSNGLVASANEQSSVGVAGNWAVRVSLVNFSGTVNFRVEKL
ncbi:MAG: hypothetical protein OEV49_14165 [candidate division Zixibacteria bacterium]|nr:hypothetical protein [candidate division Zixibacteria bacterium]MDH3937500.1 hypothetical protein [candidate division Zixibacteria bacterium]MDH4035462.1 hypothetical protein [candidate division Zixibacteria bacterium]